MARLGSVRLRSKVLESSPDPTQSHYAAALLKVAMRLRKCQFPDLREAEVFLDEVLGDLPLDGDGFRAYLQRNLSFLLAALGQTHT
jgi:hypothetical protein